MGEYSKNMKNIVSYITPTSSKPEKPEKHQTCSTFFSISSAISWCFGGGGHCATKLQFSALEPKGIRPSMRRLVCETHVQFVLFYNLFTCSIDFNTIVGFCVLFAVFSGTWSGT
jgi:hypothetical protein